MSNRPPLVSADPALPYNEGYGPRPKFVAPTTEQLSERELQVLDLAGNGLSDTQISKELCIANRTVRSHMSRVITKLRVKNRIQATMKARSLCLLAPTAHTEPSTAEECLRLAQHYIALAAKLLQEAP